MAEEYIHLCDYAEKCSKRDWLSFPNLPNWLSFLDNETLIVWVSSSGILIAVLFVIALHYVNYRRRNVTSEEAITIGFPAQYVDVDI